MIRLIQQIFMECLLSARPNRNQQDLLFKECLKWGSQTPNHLGCRGPSCALQLDGEEEPVFWGQSGQPEWHPFCPQTLGGAALIDWVLCLGLFRPRPFSFWRQGGFCCSVSQTDQWSQSKWSSIMFKQESEFHLPELIFVSCNYHFHFSLPCIAEGNGNPLQCSCPENPRDGGARWAAIYGVA